jgi:hypothetical protein
LSRISSFAGAYAFFEFGNGLSEKWCFDQASVAWRGLVRPTPAPRSVFFEKCQRTLSTDVLGAKQQAAPGLAAFGDEQIAGYRQGWGRDLGEALAREPQ